MIELKYMGCLIVVAAIIIVALVIAVSNDSPKDKK